jgi:hypothetical protein
MVERPLVLFHSSPSQTKARQVERIRNEMNELRYEINALLKPPQFVGRWFVVLVLSLMVAIVVTKILLVEFGVARFASIRGKAGTAKDYFRDFNDKAQGQLSASRAMQLQCNLSSDLLSLVWAEGNVTEGLVNLTWPQMVVSAGANELNMASAAFGIIWEVANVIEAIVVGLLLISVLLTCVTFKWGEDKVVCTRVAYHLGRCSLFILVVGASCVWISIGVVSAMLMFTSDFCARPSALLANISVADAGSQVQKQIAADIYNYLYVPGSILPPIFNATWPPSLGEGATKVKFNIGAFLTSCVALEGIFNPYTQAINLANTLHATAVQQLHAQPPPCAATAAPALQLYELAWRSVPANTTSCNTLYALIGVGVKTICSESDLTVSLALFLFLVLQFAFLFLLFVVWAMRYALVPSIYQIKTAQYLQKRLQVMQYELQQLVQSKRPAAVA